MRAHLLFWAAVLGASCLLAGCQNMAQFSPEYRAVHERVFWEKLQGGGGTTGDAQAWANYYAHDAAEKATGERAK